MSLWMFESVSFLCVCRLIYFPHLYSSNLLSHSQSSFALCSLNLYSPNKTKNNPKKCKQIERHPVSWFSFNTSKSIDKAELQTISKTLGEMQATKTPNEHRYLISQQNVNRNPSQSENDFRWLSTIRQSIASLIVSQKLCSELCSIIQFAFIVKLLTFLRILSALHFSLSFPFVRNIFWNVFKLRRFENVEFRIQLGK